MWPDTRSRLDSIPQGGNYRDLSEDLRRRYLNGQKWGPESGREDLSRKYFFAYRRLHPDFVSWTLNTKADCVYHYNGKRALSVREFARLSSFPDHFEIRGTDKHTRYRLVGNAVPPLLAQAIGSELRSILIGRKTAARVASR
jgi:DNA (cytosine-5)-methyltransferase 1